MISVAIAESFFTTEPADVILMYEGKMIDQGLSEPGHEQMLRTTQLLMCATTKKLIGDITTQYSYLKNAVPAITNDTWWDVKAELQQFDTDGYLDRLQPWLHNTMIPLLNILVPTHTSPTARNMQQKLKIIQAIAQYQGKWAAKIPEETVLVGTTSDSEVHLEQEH